MAPTQTPKLTDITADASERPVTAWWRGAAIISIAFALALGSVELTWLLARPLTLVLVAIIIAQALAPIVDRLQEWMPRTIAVVVVYLLLVAMLGGLGLLIIPPLAGQARTLITNAPDLLQRAERWLADIDAAGSERFFAAAESSISQLGDLLIPLPFLLFSSAIDFVLVVFMSAYWLVATPALHAFTLSLFPERHRRRTTQILREMGQTMGGYVRGTTINALIIGTLSYIGLTVIGVEYTLVLAAVAGLGEFLPIVGPIIASAPAILIALTQSPEQAGIVAIFYLVLQQVEGNLLVPIIMRNQANVPPLLSLVSIVTGSAIGGLLAAVVAIPLIGALRILVVRVLAPAERDWVTDDGPPPKSDAPAPSIDLE